MADPRNRAMRLLLVATLVGATACGSEGIGEDEQTDLVAASSTILATCAGAGEGTDSATFQAAVGTWAAHLTDHPDVKMTIKRGEPTVRDEAGRSVLPELRGCDDASFDRLSRLVNDAAS